MIHQLKLKIVTEAITIISDTVLTLTNVSGVIFLIIFMITK